MGSSPLNPGGPSFICISCIDRWDAAINGLGEERQGMIRDLVKRYKVLIAHYLTKLSIKF